MAEIKEGGRKGHKNMKQGQNEERIKERKRVNEVEKRILDIKE